MGRTLEEEIYEIVSPALRRMADATNKLSTGLKKEGDVQKKVAKEWRETREFIHQKVLEIRAMRIGARR